MRIAIKPFKQFVPGKGLVDVTHLDVRVGSYELGGEIRGNYDLLAVTTTPPPAGTPEKPKETVVTIATGHSALTKDQADAWGADDLHFVRCIAQNIGLALA